MSDATSDGTQCANACPEPRGGRPLDTRHTSVYSLILSGLKGGTEKASVSDYSNSWLGSLFRPAHSIMLCCPCLSVSSKVTRVMLQRPLPTACPPRGW